MGPISNNAKCDMFYYIESFLWEEANRVPFLIRDFSYGAHAQGDLQYLYYVHEHHESGNTEIP